MNKLLSLRTRRASRTAAAVFCAVYALLSSGAAFGVLDLASAARTAARTSSPPCTAAPCCCGPVAHAAGDCCCRHHRPPGGDLAFLHSAPCPGPDPAAAPGELTRVPPHVADAGIEAPPGPGALQASGALSSPRSADLRETDKVPIAA